MLMNTMHTTIFVCSHCDAQYTKWTGRCLECGKWSTIIETVAVDIKKSQQKDFPTATTETLETIAGGDIRRSRTGIGELDRVLGGGLVPASLMLLGGEPGIGKSTLSIQLAGQLQNTLYISGEESTSQIKLRADRLGITNPTLHLANETQINSIIGTIKKMKPSLAIIDSIQTIWSEEASGEAGSINQIRAGTVMLLEAAKTNGVPICLIGHVTKDGAVAGPKTLEHLVDTVLYLEGERHHAYRILRTVKNRFGSTDEVGIFEMAETGLKEVKNPSASFLEERGENMPGSVVTCLMEGTRPLLVEIQALVNKTSFGYPVRKASGFDLNRLHVLVAVLQKRARLNLAESDIHINVVGGMKANEPAADLAVSLAIASSFKDKMLGKDLAVFGEVGLGGEVRSVAHTEKRVKEAEALGMKRIILSAGSQAKTSDAALVPVKNIQDLIRHA